MSAALYPRDGAVRRGSTALLVIDVQRYCALPGEGYNKDIDPNNMTEQQQYLFSRLDTTTLPAIQGLLSSFRQHRDASNVIYTYIESLTKDGRDDSLDYKLSGLHVPKGSPDAQILDQVAPDGDEIMIPKTSCSVFCSTNIEYVLRNLGVSQLVVTGIVTNQCVESAVRDAADRGFYVIVPEEAVATTSQADHDQSLKNMRGFARICSYQDIIDEMKKWNA